MGPFLFVIFINNIGKAIKKTDAVKNFADDTKMGKRIMSDQDRTSLQEALDAVSRWLGVMGNVIIVPKCNVMHLGHNNPRHQFQMNAQTLLETQEEDIWH